MLEDVDRIDLIRGPGALVCGAKAVNGVIHLHPPQVSKITQSALRPRLAEAQKLRVPAGVTLRCGC